MSEEKKTLLGSVKVSALIAKKQAAIKKMEMSDLREIYLKIGNSAYTRGVGQEQLPEQYKAIIDLDAEIQKKKTHAALPETATVSDKAKHAAVLAKDRAAVEALLLRRKGLIADLGRDISGYEVDDQEIATLQQDAKAIEASIEAAKAEVATLEQQVSGIAKKPFLAGGIAILALFLVIGAIAGLKSSCSQSGQMKRATREAQRAAADVGRDVAEMQREMLEIEMQMKNEQLAEAERRKLERARIELEGRQRELASQQEQAERERQREIDQLRIAQETEARRREEQVAAEERRRTDEQTRIQEQQDRARLAAMRFKEITLEPNFYPSKSLLTYGATVEIRGQGWDEIKRLHQSENWLGLLSYLLDQPHTDYPDARQIERAVDNLKRRQLFILCRTTARNTRDSSLILLTLSSSSRAAVSDSTRWDPHPDGIGYTHAWSLAHSGGIILYGNYWNDFRPHVNRLNESFRERVKALDDQRRLGEITEQTRQERLSETIRRAHAAAISWAREQ